MTPKSVIPRLFLLLAVVLIGQFALRFTEQTVDPIVATDVALANVNGADADLVNQRAYETARRFPYQAALYGLYLGVAGVLFIPPVLKARAEAARKRVLAEK